MPRKSAPKRPATRSSSSSPGKPRGGNSSAGNSSAGKSSAGKPSAGKKGAGRKRSETGAGDGNPQRLQKVLASAGFGSRRQCEELIVEGRVEVDGHVVTELGTQVDPKTSKIYVDGSLLKRERLAYFVVNKPPGVVTTNSDPQGRTRVIDLVQERQRLFPVGRLDRSSEGLILLTNDGDLAQQLAHPKYGVRKTYRVTVAGKVDSEKLMQMKRGIYIAEGRVGVDGAKILRHRGQATELEILLREGKNREIRRILARLGHKVLTLQRVAIGPLRLGELPRGAYRPVSSDELRRLREEIHIQSKRVAEGQTDEEGAGDEHWQSGDGDQEPSERPPKTAKKPSRHAASPASGGKTPYKSIPQTAAKKAATKRPAAAGPRSKPLEGSKTIGTVIGGESDAAAKREQTPPRTPRPTRSTGKPASKSASNSAGKFSGKSAAAKAPKGKRPPKKERGEGR